MSRAALALAVISTFTASGLSATGPTRYPGGPPETATLAPGPNVETAQLQCGMCHSVDYITTQPRSFADPRAVWTAEVAKMRKAYGAPLTDEDAAKVVDYLVAAYGR